MRVGLLGLVLLAVVGGFAWARQAPPGPGAGTPPAAGGPPAGTPAQEPSAAQKQQTEQQELRKAIDDAANDRAALVKNLEAFLKKYPESPQRPQIYRALVESCLQLRDFQRATEYSERMVTLNPEDISNMVLTIELLERYGDVSGYRRAVFYASRVLEYLDRSSPQDKSPRISAEDWAAGRRRDKASVLLARGRLYMKLNDLRNAQKDFEASYALVPSASVAEHLGEIAELKKDLNTAILEYARAFNLSESGNGAPSRAELRKKLGNVWRLAHGSEDGLGDYLLHNFDDTVTASAPTHEPRNANAKEPYDFVLRKASDGSAVPLRAAKGKILVLTFWATWCGPCRELEPHFDRIAARYSGRTDVVFYALNCDDDETLVAPYLEGVKLKTPTLFADGLEHLLGVDSFPTTVILDRNGKIAFRANGFDPDGFEKSLTDAVERAAGAGSGTPTAAVGP
jgi:thiol-disulfide isomerase/thioredoxin